MRQRPSTRALGTHIGLQNHPHYGLPFLQLRVRCGFLLLSQVWLEKGPKRPASMLEELRKHSSDHICSLSVDREAQMLEDQVDSRRHPTRTHGRKSFTECSDKGLFRVASRMPYRGRWTASLVCASNTLPISIKWGLELVR